MKLSDDVIRFFERQPYTIVSTVDTKGYAHSSCKGIVKIISSGRIYLLDLYKRKTHENLKQNPCITITAVDEHRFKGYCLKGKAKIIKRNKLSSHLIKAWEKNINNRITQRIIKNIQREIPGYKHPEVLLPKPEYLIVIQVKEVVDLTPQDLK